VIPLRLRGDGVAKRFGRVAALRGIDFEIAPGESVSILGANGAGKSTLLRILAGLSRPSEGRFEALREHPSGGTRPLARERLRGEVGYVGHATLVYGDLTARENLVFAARLQGRPASPGHIDSLLEQVRLREVADRRAGTFSRGLAQRLSIARAIVHDPPVLLLDEPFTGLDEVSAERLAEQLSALRAGGRSLVLVTHDARRGVELTDRALVLHRGEIVARAGRQAAGTEGIPFVAEALRKTLARLAHGAAGGSA
jgi:heme ABC exporter ATP-binding subunit CcmA